MDMSWETPASPTLVRIESRSRAMRPPARMRKMRRPEAPRRKGRRPISREETSTELHKLASNPCGQERASASRQVTRRV